MSSNEGESERPAKRVRLSPSRAKQSNISAGSTVLINDATSANTDAPVVDPKEIEVGITEYASEDVEPFQALLKTRYTDFMVNEILPDGHVVRLTNIALPEKLQSSSSSKKKKSGKKAEHQQNISNGVGSDTRTDSATNDTDNPSTTSATNGTKIPIEVAVSSEISEDDKQKLISYLNETAVNQVLALYKDILKHPNRKAKDHSMVRTEFTNDRSVRAEIHGTIRRVFSSRIESSTDKDGFLCLTAANMQSRQPPPGGYDEDKPYYPGKLGWLERGGEYLHFTLYKENKDTMEAISFLARQLKTSAKTFQFAGTKDRRAVTSQRVSAYRLDAERLVKQNYHLHSAAVGDFEYKQSSLELGDLGGNEFVLTLRQCEFPQLSQEDLITKSKSALDLALTNLRTKGFLNYYGLQRFGTFTTRTDTTGRHILKNDFRSACEAILHYDAESLSTHEEGEAPNTGPSVPRDEVNRAKAIQLFQQTGNAHKPLELLPRKFSAENQIMRHLARSPTDYVGALLTIPRNLRLMYVHAYQSLVWNKAATKRWRLHGSRVVEGDLVLIKEHTDKELGASSTDELGAGGVDADGEVIIVPQDHDRAGQIDDIFDRARALTAAEAAGDKYTIFDVVLPLPGYDVIYPANASGQFYKDFMTSDEGGNLDPYDMRRKQKDFSLSGGYRKLMASIGPDFNVEVHPYKRDEEQFVQTDLERVRAAVKEPKQEEELGQKESTDADVGESADVSMADDGVKDKIAVVLKFQLGASQYATMALRELSRGGIAAYKAEIGSAK